MKTSLFQLFSQHPDAAFFVSILVSIVIAILGVVPSVFVTAANILFFGFYKGVLVSFLGEALGAVISFFLYRYGFKNSMQSTLQSHPRVLKLAEAKGGHAFGLIFSMRLLPFIPSGLITFAAAVGEVSAAVFTAASSLGKLPALFLEAYSVNEVTRFTWQGKMILIFVALMILIFVVKKIVGSSTP